jgi:uncharacterized protein
MRGSIMKANSISLESVSNEPLHLESELAVGASALDREPLLALSPLRLSGDVSRIEGGYALTARLSYDGQLECSRCLTAYPFHEDEEFSLVLYPRQKQPGTDLELDLGDLDTQYFDQPVIELSPIAEERVQMALPMKPLCRPDCLGLCPTCGKDLNLGSCACARDTVDPRWEALRALKEKV